MCLPLKSQLILVTPERMPNYAFKFVKTMTISLILVQLEWKHSMDIKIHIVTYSDLLAVSDLDHSVKLFD